MSLSTISIGGNDYTAYASVAEADEYLAVDPNRGPTWDALDVDEKGSFLVSATRRLDRENWQGTKTGGAAQEEDWPRTGLTYEETGEPVSTTEVPLEIEQACILQAGSTAVNNKAALNEGSGSNIKRVAAGSANVTFFRAQEGNTIQDQDVFALIRQWLEGSAVDANTGNEAYGTCDPSAFTNDKRFDRTRGFA